MVEFLYIDETGSVGKGARQQPLLTLAAAIVPEEKVQPLNVALKEVAFKHLGWVPTDFEFHGVDLWGGSGNWDGKTPPELLSAYEDAIALLPQLGIKVAHSAIHKSNLNARYGGRYDQKAYLLALQFLLERIEQKRPSGLKVVVADEQKEHQLSAIALVADLQDHSEGEVPGKKLVSVIDSLHFVKSSDSAGVQMADLIAFALQRKHYGLDTHPDAISRLDGIYNVIIGSRIGWREPWPSAPGR